MRREYDGYNDEALADPTTDCRELITGADFDGEGAVFWLRYIIIRNSHASTDAILELYDQDEGAATGANQRGAIDVPASTTTYIEFPAPGKSFKTNLTAGINGGSGTISAYNVVAGGYLVGGME